MIYTVTICKIFRHKDIFNPSNIQFLQVQNKVRNKYDRKFCSLDTSEVREKMNVSVERSACIFCNIINKLENTEILYEDENVCIFPDIKPASDYHVLTVPKRHIEDAKSLTSSDKELVNNMIAASKALLQKKNFNIDDVRFGFHWPPFRSVKHLHLHTIAPESKMGYLSKAVFMKGSYWFVSPEYVLSRL